MLKHKLLFFGLLGLLALSSCSIFHKGCGCPKFGVHYKPAFNNPVS
jgi:hypothetical protein